MERSQRKWQPAVTTVSAKALSLISKVKFKTLISCCCFRCLECRWRMEIVIEQSHDSRDSYYFYLRILYCVYPLSVPGRIRFSKISRVVQKWWNKALYTMSRGLFTFHSSIFAFYFWSKHRHRSHSKYSKIQITAEKWRAMEVAGIYLSWLRKNYSQALLGN